MMRTVSSRQVARLKVSLEENRRHLGAAASSRDVAREEYQVRTSMGGPGAGGS